jgi:tetratricopeptide (TPR) repeat protein
MINKRHPIFLLIALIAASSWAGACLGQTDQIAAPNETVSAREESQRRFDELRRRGYDALYSLDYEEARRTFKEMLRLYPDHPAGAQCMAATLWLEELNRSRHIQASLYSTESFYSRDEKPDPRMVDQFRQWTRMARQLAEARLKRTPRDVEALYFLGVTEGLKAVFAAAVERRFMSALGDASRAVDRHREVLRLDPGFHDAELSLGMYQYIVGSLPLPVKMVASIGGVRGSKKRGLEILESVTKEGRWAQGIARLLLIDLYKREKRWDDALAMAQTLSREYPRNYLFQLQAADALVARIGSVRKTKGVAVTSTEADVQNTIRIFEALLHDRTPANVAARVIASDLIHFRYGEALMIFGQPERAADEFRAAIDKAGLQSTLRSLARLRAAQALDVAGKRREALLEYRAVLEGPKTQRSFDEARRGLDQPYRNE